MKYNFDEIIDRKNTNSSKWDALEQRFGASDVLPLWVADMDFRVPEQVRIALKNTAEHGVFGYTVRPDSFYEAIIDWHARRHDWQIEKEWITISSGAVASLSMLVQAFTEPGDQIVIQSPVYHPFFSVIEKNGRELVDNTLVFDGEHYRMDFDDLEKKLSNEASKVLILCNPHNPVGRVWTKEELTKLGDLCLKHQVLVISDEVHCDLILNDHIHTPFASISKEFSEHSITCVAPSKTFNLAGLQASAIVIPNEENERKFKESLNIQDTGMTNPFAVTALEAAYNHGDEWLDQLLIYLQRNVDFLSAFFKQNLPQINVIQPEGTYLVWLDFRSLNLSAKELEKFLLSKAKVALNQGYIFGQAGEGFVRINIACPQATLKEGLKRISNAVKEYSQ